jgi:hypothetical protein
MPKAPDPPAAPPPAPEVVDYSASEEIGRARQRELKRQKAALSRYGTIYTLPGGALSKGVSGNSGSGKALLGQ